MTAPPEDLKTFARTVLDMTSGDYDEAERQLRFRLRRDSGQWLDMMVNYVAERLVADARHRERMLIQRPVTEPTAAHQPRALYALRKRKEELEEAYLNWPLSTGVRLREATLADLKNEYGMYDTLTRSNAARRDWIGNIMKRLGDNATVKVGEALTGAEIRQLDQEATAKWQAA